MGFEIGSQHGVYINNVDGDQFNQVTFSDADAREQFRQLRAVLERAGVPPDVAPQASAHLDEVEAEMARPTPSKPAVAAQLKQLFKVLVSAGTLARAGGALAGPVGAVAGWLGGTLGKPILDAMAHRS